jgi:tRNA-specific 2-thiouridylase
MNKKIAVAMSGGIDSSVAAALVKESGAETIGVFMKVYSDYSKDSEKGARKIAQILNIPFFVLDFKKEFKNKIIDYFLEGYKKGITPNPCVLCNKEIKFGILLKEVKKMGVDFLATGHYARMVKQKLLKAKDKKKDQTYFLWQLNQRKLKHILFPVGGYTKKQVKDLAKEFKLPILDIPESQEVCFIKDTCNDFLLKNLKKNPGNIINTRGEIIGKHNGLWFYTIGQRKGIDISGKKPLYVLKKDIKKNALIVTEDKKELEKKELIIKNINWISGEKPKLPLNVMVKIRYRSSLSHATIIKDVVYKVVFDKSQRAITPGQSVVFYKGLELLGGGIIL